MTYKEYINIETILNSNRISAICNLVQNLQPCDFPILEVDQATFDMLRANTSIIDISEDLTNSLYDYFGTFVRLKVI